MPNLTSETGKLVRDRSHVLKPSAISQALETAGLTIDTHLVRGLSHGFIDAQFWPAGRIPYDRFYVTVGTVPRERAQQARLFVEQEALPNLIAWIADILGRDPRSPVRRENQSLRIAIST